MTFIGTHPAILHAEATGYAPGCEPDERLEAAVEAIAGNSYNAHAAIITLARACCTDEALAPFRTLMAGIKAIQEPPARWHFSGYDEPGDILCAGLEDVLDTIAHFAGHDVDDTRTVKGLGTRINEAAWEFAQDQAAGDREDYEMARGDWE